MSTISVPLTPALELFLESQIKSGVKTSKAQIVREALDMYREEKEIQELLISQKEAKAGKLFKGDLRELAKKLR